MDQQYWNNVIDRYKASGQFQEDFCQSENISINKFKYYWQKHRRKLKQGEQPRQMQPTGGFESVSVYQSPTKENPRKTTHQIRIETLSGIKCTVSFEGGPKDLVSFLKELNQ